MKTITPFRFPFDATLTMPGSKSHANRAIMCACLKKGTTTIRNATPCDDVLLLAGNLRTMGFDVCWRNKREGVLEVRGGIPEGKRKRVKDEGTVLHCGNAGTTLRFLTSLACVVPGKWTITGNARMRKRPIGDLVKALRALGARIEDTNGCPPISVIGETLEGGTVKLDASRSSQFYSSLILVSSALRHPITVALTSSLSSPEYAELTKRVLKDFQKSPTTYDIEGDWSSAGAFLVLAELTRGRARFTNLSKHSEQADRKLPDVIKRMRKRGSMTINCADIPDQVMNLAVLAAFRNGETTITGIANLRLKECDRLAVLTKELRKAGVRVKEHSDGVTVRGKMDTGPPVLLDPHDDHRMVMAFAVLGSVRTGVLIKHPDCVSKSYPDFFSDLRSLHASPRCIAIIGMRGCGKSSLGKKLAEKLRLKHIDTDAVFERSNGRIGAFVRRKGWKPFRREEARIVSRSMLPGVVVSLGGGAVETSAVRKALRENAVVIWMQKSAPSIIKQLKTAKRPPLTNLPLEQEVRTVLKKRAPLYRSLADITLSEHIPIPKRLAFLISKLEEQCTS